MESYNNFSKLNRFFITLHPCFFFFIISLFCFLLEPYAQNTQEIRKQLLKKGLTEKTLNLLAPRCLEGLNRRVPDDTIWYATFDRDAKSITVDFQTGVKAVHNSVTVVSLKNEGCMTVVNTSIMAIGPCKVEADWWINNYKQRGIKMSIEEESPKRICLGAEGNLGIKIYFYTAGNLCMEVFRNVEIIK